MRAEDRLARQGQPAKAEFGGALHFRNRAFQVASGEAGHGRHPVVVGAEGLPSPVVPAAAASHGEFGVWGGPHRQALVREDDFGLHAVGFHVPQALFRGGAGGVAPPVFALQGSLEADACRAIALGDLPTLALLVNLHPRQPMGQLRIDAFGEKVVGLVGVAIRRHHEEFVRRARPGGALPSRVARRLPPPRISRFVHRTPPFDAEAFRPLARRQRSPMLPGIVSQNQHADSPRPLNTLVLPQSRWRDTPRWRSGEARSTQQPPLQQREGRIRVVMALKNALDGRSERHLPVWVAEQVAHQPHPACGRNFHQCH